MEGIKKTLKTIWAIIAYTLDILYWFIVGTIKWLHKAAPKTKKDASIFLNLIFINYFLLVNFAYPAVAGELQRLYREHRPGVETVEKTVVVEKELEPTDPDAWVAWRIAKAGLNPIEAMVINSRESGYENNDNKFNVNSNGSIDLGRWMWNSIHLESGFITIKCAGDYKCSTEKAIEKRLKDGNWSAWYGAKAAGIK